MIGDHAGNAVHRHTDRSAAVENVPPHDLRFDLLEHVADLLNGKGRILGPFRSEMPQCFRLGGKQTQECEYYGPPMLCPNRTARSTSAWRITGSIARANRSCV